jgi:TonB-dependent SusC/RagA subfamily outer membrane receptor
MALAACSRTTPPPQTASSSDVTTSTGLVTTGAIDSLSSEQLRGRHAGDVAEMLQGRVAGLQVIRLGNGDISLRIRGDDSILSNGEPLVILDGAPVASQNISEVLRGLNPREIASIDVLKDVASTAAYGIKGAHGVIIITMKHER